ncbi:hypothetical protein D3C71_1934970 [compost metagenome]
MRVDLLPHRCKRYAARIALKQPQPQAGFQLRHSPAELGTLHIQHTRGGGKPAFFDDLAEKQQVVQVVNVGRHGVFKGEVSGEACIVL